MRRLTLGLVVALLLAGSVRLLAAPQATTHSSQAISAPRPVITVIVARCSPTTAERCVRIAAVRFPAMGEYNLNPAYCHSHWIWDPLWYVYECWLPDPPGSEGG